MSGESVYKKEDASWGMLLKGRNSLKITRFSGEWHLHATNAYITITIYLTFYCSVISGA